MKDLIGQELHKGDLVAVVWAGGGLITGRIYGFKTRPRQFYRRDSKGNILVDPVTGRKMTHWVHVYAEARVVTEGGSRKTKESSQIIKIDKLASLDSQDKLVLH